ncbi:hypothetical protein PKHYL_07670 [Psychrobacter sp. KH172YL61]|uniref:type ISP restriction/modification enzyme n=1 Tax=Psychrobacter sp. KH172YL61 TaxID=2517899 RepID=UPI0010B30658|nr:type ISP restriction/modification enzyme [Psychrobacter sp. KH172YL61]BBI66576.1 hypothetical protein PKHYL_07670 [Psychrobacter sp. KH172YL61]
MRATYYDTSLQRRPSWNTIKHLNEDNISLITCRQQSTFDFQHIFLSKAIIERCTVSLQTKETGYIFPLYLYPEQDTQTNLLESKDEDKPARTPNLDTEIVTDIAKAIGLTFTNERKIRLARLRR